MGKSFQRYLVDGIDLRIPNERTVSGYENIIDHSLRAEKNAAGEVSFYIHPSGKDGETLSFFAKGNCLVPLTNNSEWQPDELWDEEKIDDFRGLINLILGSANASDCIKKKARSEERRVGKECRS